MSFTGGSLGIQKCLGFADYFQERFVDAAKGFAVHFVDGIGGVIKYHDAAGSRRGDGGKGLFHSHADQVVGHTFPKKVRGFAWIKTGFDEIFQPIAGQKIRGDERDTAGIDSALTQQLELESLGPGQVNF